MYFLEPDSGIELFGELSVVPNLNLPGLRFFVYCICIIMWHSHLNASTPYVVEFVFGSLPCSERFFSGYSGFPSPQKPTPPIRSGTHGHV